MICYLPSGKFPKEMKKALIKPLIKKTSLDPSDYKNYWPASNLGFVSKVIERAVANQLKSYISTNNLDTEPQLAYGAKHSMETALLKVVRNICLASDQNQGVILMLLDLSAAFDTVDHDINIGQLINWLGIIHGVVLQWLNSYLPSHTQNVLFGESQVSSRPSVICNVCAPLEMTHNCMLLLTISAICLPT